tara:strand:- start:183 stop:587 length:405 start_codon:yes stop_codon:yes gene_type:complete
MVLGITNRITTDMALAIAKIQNQIDNAPEGPQKDRLQSQFNQVLDNPTQAAIEKVKEEVSELPSVVGEIGSLSLRFVEGFGAAFVKGLDGAYDAVRDKLRGKEPDVIAGFTVAAISILTMVYLYQSAKAARDAF